MLYITAYNHKKSSTYRRLSFGVNLTSKSLWSGLWYADEADGFINDGLYFYARSTASVYARINVSSSKT